ncbi:hypothetical protein Taro_031968 [Colocasia esculenta]|uniref:Uncharacterized protein n=1 Tax=Colocasia esculenta TaxID=4460 RepID=A0A843VY07_COLES|nr:hypothetical protein [Colocasia esculenta]
MDLFRSGLRVEAEQQGEAFSLGRFAAVNSYCIVLVSRTFESPWNTGLSTGDSHLSTGHLYLSTGRKRSYETGKKIFS